MMFKSSSISEREKFLDCETINLKTEVGNLSELLIAKLYSVMATIPEIPVRVVKDLIEFSDRVSDLKGREFVVTGYCKIKSFKYLGPGVIESVEIVHYRDLQEYFNNGPGDPITRTFGRTNLPEEIEYCIKFRDVYSEVFLNS